ncbi:MAG: hypothetical protein QXU18_00190 [Thermoplasmatales archaeon]
MIDSVPDAVKNTCLNINSEKGEKLELNVIGWNCYLYKEKGVWGRKKKKPVMKTVLPGSADEN